MSENDRQRRGFLPTPSDPDDGLTFVLVANNMGGHTHIELFDRRPRTVGAGGDPADWPDQYEVWEGYINGGDTRLVERYPERKGVARCGHRDWRDGHCSTMTCVNYVGRCDPLRHATEADRTKR